MIKIENAVHFNELVKAFKGLHSKVLSNCFLMPDEINSLAEKNRLFASEYPGWLFIISDSSDYSNLYYYTCEDSDPEQAKALIADCGDRELFIDIVTKNSRGDNETPEKLIKAGFAADYKNYVRLQQLARDMDFDSYNATPVEGYHWSEDYDDYDAAMALWKLGLDEKSTELPTRESFDEHKKDGSIFFIVDDQNDLAAVILNSQAIRFLFSTSVFHLTTEESISVTQWYTNPSFMLTKEASRSISSGLLKKMWQSSLL